MMMNQTVPLSVSELNEYTRRLMAGDPLLRSLEVTGEITGYKHYANGHRYFALKDENARVDCAFFVQHSGSLKFQPADGMRVIVKGSASLFVRDGKFQFYVHEMRRAGQGELFERIEALKKKLYAEGLFDPARKRSIPLLPRTIGVATSKSGKAIRDIVHVARKNNPNVGIVLAHCTVEGPTAPEEIVRAIERLNRFGGCDVLLVGRGGGSSDSLWVFNDERVARAVAASKVPVISCVGHETDITITDLVADVYANTPSTAASLAVPKRDELKSQVNVMMNRVCRALTHAQQLRRMRLEKLCMASSMARPAEVMILPRRRLLELLCRRADAALPRRLEKARMRLQSLEASLRALDPDAVLDRGYAIVEGEGGIIENTKGVQIGDAVTVRMADGRLGANITSIETEEDAV